MRLPLKLAGDWRARAVLGLLWPPRPGAHSSRPAVNIVALQTSPSAVMICVLLRSSPDARASAALLVLSVVGVGVRSGRRPW